jgi:hypothetical protein
MKTLTVQVPESMVFWAFRYCLGRQSYAVSSFIEGAVPILDELPKHDLERMIREINDAIEENRAGMPMDIKQWNYFCARCRESLRRAA